MPPDLKNISNVYRFHEELNRPFRNTRQLLSRGLSLIADFLDLDQVSFFIWDPLESVLALRLVWRGGECMDIEEDIHISEDSPLRAVFEGDKAYISKNFYYPAYYISLNWQGYTSKIGLKLSPYQSRRMGVLRLTRFKNRWTLTKNEKETASLLCRELAYKMSLAELNQFHREQLTRANALSELNTIFASSMRVEDSLKLILRGIQKYFGFDRVRLYLIDNKNKCLTGQFSADVRGKITPLLREQISLSGDRQHPFADIILKTKTNIVLDKYRDTMVYLPMSVKGKKVGLIIVDNLLSQQPILHDDLVSLSSFSGQIALAVDNATLFDRVQELSQFDELTGLPVRRYFTERFQEEIYRAKRFNIPMSVIWMDIDNFKPINDKYGHKTGDEVLRQISKVILANLRKIDFPCRYGGDEILIMLPQAKAEEAKITAKRLADEIRKIKIPIKKTGILKGLTVSQGISVYPGDADSAQEILQKADEALYWAKTHGRNKSALFAALKK